MFKSFCSCLGIMSEIYMKQSPTLDLVGTRSILQPGMSITYQEVVFTDPAFRYGNDIKLHSQETKKEFKFINVE